MKAFSEMGLEPRLVETLKRHNFVNPTEVQENTIPVALEGKDVIVRAKTGTGKTLAFLIPIKQRSKPGPYPEAIVLAPTRELALQIADVAKRLNANPNHGIAVVYGGASINVQMQDLRRNPDIIIGTPGRVIDLIERGALNLERIKFLVLDEADTMLDMGFILDVEFILSKTPREKQTMIFSATMPEKIRTIAKRHMNDPAFIRIGEEDDIVVSKIKHLYAEVDNRMKFATLLAYIEEYKPKKAIIFAQTKYAANAIYDAMKGQGLDVVMMHGGLTQAKREHSLREFKNNGRFLIATNVAARGIDIAGISDIINFDVTEDPRTYVHRVGRSARMNNDGRSFTIVNGSQRNIISDIEDSVNVKFEKISPDGSAYKEIVIFRRGGGGSFGGGRGGFRGRRDNPRRQWGNNNFERGGRPGQGSGDRFRRNEGFHGSGERSGRSFNREGGNNRSHSRGGFRFQKRSNTRH